MPEGDTIHRSARNLAKWLEGREITAARAGRRDVPVQRLVGQTLEAVEARGKHLLMRFSPSRLVLHTHMKMTGSWHVYPAGERWRKPEWQARVVLESGDRVAVCFNAPVVELLRPEAEHVHPGLVDLGPDVLVRPVDLELVRRRARERVARHVAIGEVLLDQRVVAGIGNIWRCETLFLRRLDPWTPWSSLDDVAFDACITTASDLMARSVLGAGRPAAVYGRTRRRCYRCRTPIRSAALPAGANPRIVYWCPRCQASAERS